MGESNKPEPDLAAVDRALEAPENPPAFPHRGYADGMTLRDYFAGQWLAGRAAAGWIADEDRTAREAYEIADALLAARRPR